jgi:uncharacterized protein (UPF0332 family)
LLLVTFHHDEGAGDATEIAPLAGWEGGRGGYRYRLYFSRPCAIAYNHVMREETRQGFLEKAAESLEGAESELAQDRYNTCANRSYYCCFQAAIAALLADGIMLTGGRTTWGHDFVQAQFVGQLINRRKVYPADLRDTLARNLILRHIADYTTEFVTETQARRAVRRARDFFAAVAARKAE